jgi:hypothetical protein
MMKVAPALTAALTGFAMLLCPIARAEPTADDIYSKWLSEYSVNYQGRYTFDEMTQEGQRVCALLDEVANAKTLQNAQQRLIDQLGFNKKEAAGIIHSAIESYCHQYSELVMSSGIMSS